MNQSFGLMTRNQKIGVALVALLLPCGCCGGMAADNFVAIPRPIPAASSPPALRACCCLTTMSRPRPYLRAMKLGGWA